MTEAVLNGRVRAGTEAATDQTRPAAKQVSQPWGRKPKRRFAPATIMLYSVLFVSAVYYLLPLYVMVVTSLKGMPEIRLGNIWDVWAHRHANMELYGTEGSLYLPDPNFFGGEVQLAKPGEPAEPVENWEHPFAIANEQHSQGMMANYRAAGLADMATAILDGRDMRCSLERALHGVDVMLAILRSGEEKRFIDIETRCTRPEALDIAAAEALLQPEENRKKRAAN